MKYRLSIVQALSLFVLLVLLLLSVFLKQAYGPHYNLFVDNSRGDSISVIDLDSLKIASEITLADRIHGLAVQSDGKRLFATVESDNTLRVVDLRTKQTIGTVKLSGRPNQCAVTPDGKRVVVPIRDRDELQIVDMGRLRVDKTLPILEPHNAVSVRSNRYVYVSSMGGDEIDVVDLEKMDYSAHIPVGGRPRPYVVTSNGDTMYVALANLHGFAVVDVRNRKVLRRIELPAKHQGDPRPRHYETPDTRTHGLALSPDERELWVTSLLDDCIYIYDVNAQKVIGSVATGDGPNWVIFSPDGKLAAVSNTDSNDVSIFNVKSRRETARIKVGLAPKRLAIGIAD